MTSTTSPTVSISVNFTSRTESRIDCDLSNPISRWTEAGICCRNRGNSSFTASAISTVLVPGCRCTASEIARRPLYQLAALSF